MHAEGVDSERRSTNAEYLFHSSMPVYGHYRASGIRPGVYAGLEENKPWLMSGPFTGLLDARGLSRTPRTPVNGRDKEKQQQRN
jgi:hypothetical protein